MVAIVVAEKPSAARNMAAALGGQKGIYQGTAYEIAALRGHLYEFTPPHEMVPPSLAEKYRKWDLENLPWSPSDLSWKREPQKNADDVIRVLHNALTKGDEIVIATDLDPSGEGDLLFWEAIEELGFHRKRKRFSRMEFTDESPRSIQKAFQHRRPVASMQDEGDYRKAAYRTQFDFLSMQFSRIATAMARSSGEDTVLRQGRLKSAMVMLVGDQLKAHTDYIKKPFFQNRFKDENGVMYINPDEPRYDTKGQVPHQYSPSPVVLDSKAKKKTAPPKLLDLAGLSSRLVNEGMKAQRTLKTYQAMYEAHLVSYPRTEDKTITPAQFAELAPLVDKIAEVVGVDTALLTHREPRTTHVKPRGAHGANRPGTKVPSSLDEVERKFGRDGRLIYETLAKNYLAMIAEDYVYEQQKGHVQQYPDFVGIATVPLSMGWKQVFDPDSGGDASEDDPSENVKGLGSHAEPFVHEGANKRPEHPSMKWLMKQLEQRDVGTGATRTSIYSEVTSTTAKYPLLVEKDKKLKLTRAGEMSWLLLPGTNIGNLALTEKVYADMRDIASGQATAEKCLEVVADWVREDISTMQKNAVAMRAALGLKEQPVVRRERAEGVWSKTGTSVAFTREWGGHRFSDQEVEQLLAGETIEFSATSRAGKTYHVFGELVEGTYKGRTFVGFQRLGFGERDANGQVLPPKRWCGVDFTAEQVAALAAGKTIEGKGFTSKNGKKFDAKLQWKDKGGEKRIVPLFG
ncbi:DNA topoisomerase [Streptomyces sp. NRRL F-5053]|uniref:DNA topoisomerase n=1 Tax=Streptomyces sp. NRRL F-5053 TaxID=1463854 RepID=UPI0004C7AAEE|nr:DNA topoisomerase [Streptomyces sp. NRRL F-5053]